MAFNINNFLNAESKKGIKADWKPVKISAKKLRPAPEKTNFYHAEDREIKDLAESIELIGLQQYPVVRPIEETDEYEIIAGHKRRLAILRLLGEGKTEYEMVPCKVETPDDIQNELILIFTNSTQRERTDYEKMREIERVRELLAEYQKMHELTGQKQKIIAEILGTNKTKVGTLNHINRNLIEPFKGEFAAGKISTNTANEIAGLKPEAQQALHETYNQTGYLTAAEAKAAKESTKRQQEQKKEGVDKSERQQDYEDAHPESITSLCYSCLKYSNCNVKSGTCRKCDQYANKVEVEKTEEQRYSEEQGRIDRETKKKLREREQTEQMERLPSDMQEEGVKVHQIRLLTKYFDDVLSGKKSFELRKNDRDYKVGDILEMTEFKDGKNTGRMARMIVTYFLDGFTGIEDGYCILGTAPMNEDGKEPQRDDAKKIKPLEPIRPEFPSLKNNDQRKEWLRNYKEWGLWYEDENIGCRYYKYDFENGARLIAETYQIPKGKYFESYEVAYMHLIGGPEPPKDKTGGYGKWQRHDTYNRHPNSDTELVEFLKYVEKERAGKESR